MDLRQLTVLVAVAEAGSFSAAARAMHTVQSNVSTHVARLERELGVALVDRASGVLTEEGEAVVSRARHIHAELDAIVADVAALRDEVTGTVRLGCIGTSARWLVPLVLEAVTRQHPKVHVIVVDATTTSLVPRLLADELDLAVVNLPVTHPEVRHRAPLRRGPDPHRPATGTPSPRRRACRFADLAGHELLLEPSGTAFRDELDREASAAGIELQSQSGGGRPPPHRVACLRGVRRGHRAGHRRARMAQRRLEPGARSTAWNAARSGWRAASGGSSPRPARALHDAVTSVVAADGEGFAGVHRADT